MVARSRSKSSSVSPRPRLSTPSTDPRAIADRALGDWRDQVKRGRVVPMPPGPALSTGLSKSIQRGCVLGSASARGQDAPGSAPSQSSSSGSFGGRLCQAPPLSSHTEQGGGLLDSEKDHCCPVKLVKASWQSCPGSQGRISRSGAGKPSRGDLDQVPLACGVQLAEPNASPMHSPDKSPDKSPAARFAGWWDAAKVFWL